MNQHQLIEIIGNKDVTTIIQDYMCGTPLVRPDDDSDDEIEDEIEDVQRAIELCRFKKKLRDLLYKQIKDDHLSFNNRNQTERRIFGIPDVEKQPIYALMFKINGDIDLLHQLFSIEVYFDLPIANKPYRSKTTPKKLSLLVKWKKMQNVVTELRLHGFVFEIREISNSWYKKHFF